MLPPVTMSSSWSSNSWHPVSVSSRSTVLLMIFLHSSQRPSLVWPSVAGRCLRHREVVHWRCPNQTFSDGHHSEDRSLAGSFPLDDSQIESPPAMDQGTNG